MKEVFGCRTRQVLDFLARLRDLSPAEIDLVTSAWKQASDLDRAEAWARLHTSGRLSRTPGGHGDHPHAAAAGLGILGRRVGRGRGDRRGRPDRQFL